MQPVINPAQNELSVLATDLDGTLIPLDADPQQQSDLAEISKRVDHHGVSLVFVTGRHFDSVLNAIDEFRLPIPAWILCDVGTSIFQRSDEDSWLPVARYQHHLATITAKLKLPELRHHLESVADLRLQESEKQGPFKLSYYCDAIGLETTTNRVQQQLDRRNAPWSVIPSVDPFNGDGLIDLLPMNVSKAHALQWWANRQNVRSDAIIFAGDSGNDLAALTAGYRTIVVGNADLTIIEQTKLAHQKSGWTDRLHIAGAHATSGLLEGCTRFGMT